MLHPTKKLFTSAVLAYALYTAATCPCERYLICHRPQYLGALGIAAAMAFLPDSLQ